MTSRTLEYISTFHFPPVFDVPQPPFNDGAMFGNLTEQRRTAGVANTPQGPLWQIFSSNRGGPIAVMAGDTPITTPTTEYNVGKFLPRSTDISDTAPGPGLGYLPGGVPLYKLGIPKAGMPVANFPVRAVGGIGCYVTDPMTGQPDFATIKIRYVPDELCVELKSLKLYLWSFRDEGHFHEAVTNRILDDLVALLAPRFMTIEGQFNVRGGIGTTVVVQHSKDVASA